MNADTQQSGSKQLAPLAAKGAPPFSEPRLIIGARIRERREAMGLSQRKLADRAGIRHTHISRIELAQSGVSVEVLARIALALGKPVVWFLADYGVAGTEGMPSQKLSRDEAEVVALFRGLAQCDQNHVVRTMCLYAGNTARRKDGAVEGLQSGVWQPLAPGERQPSGSIGIGHSIFVVSDDSMRDCGIRNGDLLALKPPPPVCGDIVVVDLDGSELLVRKYLPRSKACIELRAANRGIRTLLVDRSSVDVRGIVTHVRRGA